SLEEWRTHSALFDEDVSRAITPAASVSRKRTPQSTHPDAVARAREEVNRWLAAVTMDRG
ncbi:MAG: hypothetical protein ABJC51_10955, partial [Acidobacteriota bacterium]